MSNFQSSPKKARASVFDLQGVPKFWTGTASGTSACRCYDHWMCHSGNYCIRSRRTQ